MKNYMKVSFITTILMSCIAFSAYGVVDGNECKKLPEGVQGPEEFCDEQGLNMYNN